MASTLIQKLQLKPDQRLVLFNVPTDYIAIFTGQLPHIETDMENAKKCDALLAFVNTLPELNDLLPKILDHVTDSTLLWLAYPKGSSGIKTDVNRDRLWEGVRPSGWRAVRQIAIDEIWSALRFRPEK